MQVVILAAGHGRRFGGLKQLAQIGPNGESIMDYTAAAATRCGFDSFVVIVREEIREEMWAHVRRCWPTDVAVEMLCQPPVPGTAQAVLAAKPAITGPFAVVNADDLYGQDALATLIAHFRTPSAALADRHVLVSFELSRTVLNNRPVTRGLCEVGHDGTLSEISEHTVALREDGRFDARPLPSNDPHAHHGLDDVATRILSGKEPTSMNLWGFHPRLFDHLESALTRFDPSTAARPELLLPDVVGAVLRTGSDAVQVTPTTSRCIGITNPDDLTVVQDEVRFATEQEAAFASRDLES